MIDDDKKYGYGDFGNLSTNYDKFRRGMTEEMLDYLFSLINCSIPKIADIGCGTGIVSRQLVERGAKLVGVDIDSEMLEVARGHYNNEIEYIEAAAEKLPLIDQYFDAVTAFSSFHWFTNDQAMLEMKRILKPDGLIFVTNRNLDPEFHSGYINVLKPYMTEEYKNIKARFDPMTLLKTAGFSSLVERTFDLVEIRTIEDTITRIKTTSPWNLVDCDKQKVATDGLNDHFADISEKGLVKNILTIKTVAGRR